MRYYSARIKNIQIWAKWCHFGLYENCSILPDSTVFFISLSVLDLLEISCEYSVHIWRRPYIRAEQGWWPWLSDFVSKAVEGESRLSVRLFLWMVPSMKKESRYPVIRDFAVSKNHILNLLLIKFFYIRKVIESTTNQM